MVHGRCIAIVDDDASVRDAADSLFRSMGILAVAFPSAEDFLNSGCVQQTSCLVVDVHLPGMGGLQLSCHLASIGCPIPVVFMTACSDEHLSSDAVAAGALSLLTKPFSEQELVRALESCLP
jgi:FixJ family two-component response regulator